MWGGHASDDCIWVNTEKMHADSERCFVQLQVIIIPLDAQINSSVDVASAGLFQAPFHV